jgi:hypothetical protein
MALIPSAIGPAADAKEFHDRVVTGWQTQADSSSHAGPSWLVDRAAIGFAGKWNMNVLLRVNAQDPSTGDTAWFVSCAGFKWLGGGSAFLVGSVQSLGTGADAALSACAKGFRLRCGPSRQRQHPPMARGLRRHHAQGRDIVSLCATCTGACCYIPGGSLNLSPLDVARLGHGLSIVDVSAVVGEPARGCSALRHDGCSVYERRPQQCRDFSASECTLYRRKKGPHEDHTARTDSDDPHQLHAPASRGGA